MSGPPPARVRLGLAPGRLALLARLSARYALRHKRQTLRAVLGLLVATSVLAAGLGMGDSVQRSLERAALARLGDIDVMVRSHEPFDAGLAERVTRLPEVRAHGVEATATIMVTGAVLHPSAGLAEAFASVRGVAPNEPRVLGPLRAPDGSVVPEPRPGEVVLSESLARSLRAAPGDRIVLRTPVPGQFPDVGLERVDLAGLAGAPVALGEGHRVEVKEDALGLGAFVEWTGPGTTVTVEARPPTGPAFANRSATSPVQLVVEPPIEPGIWTIRVTADRPVAYVGGAGVVYPPPSLASGNVRLDARVSAIVSDEGRGGVSFRPVALVPLADLRRATGTEGLATHAFYTVEGDADAAAEAIRAALPDNERYEVTAAKLDALRDAAEAGRNISGFLTVMAGFTLLAAALLAFTLFSALVEERRSELGIARALGLTRGEVALSMTLEGALYAGAAAFAGLLVGLAVLWVLLLYIGGRVAAEGGPPIALAVDGGTLVTAFLVGALVPLATVAAASLRFARLDPARAIRNVPEDAGSARRTGYGVAVLLGVAGLLLSLHPIGRLVGLPLLGAGAAVALAARGRHAAAWAAALAAALWLVWTLYTFDDFPETADEIDPILTLARGAVLALGLSALAVASPAPYRAIARLVGRRRGWNHASFVALRWLVARRRPAGLTMGMISVVVVVVTVMGTLSLMFAGTIPDHEAGYQVVGESPLRLGSLPSPMPSDVARSVERVDLVTRHFEFRVANLTSDGEPTGPDWGVRLFLGVTPEFAEGNRYEVHYRDARYADDAEAWAAVSRGDAMAVPSWMTQRHGLDIGKQIRVETAGGPPREYTVALGVRMDHNDAVLVAEEHVRAMGFPRSTTLWVRVAPGADPTEVAHRLTAHYMDDGLTFVSIPEEAARIASVVKATLLVFELFLALGLVVGLAGTGFLATRAVHERARDIGTLRALGYERSDVRRAFVLESTVTAAGGLLVGSVAGLIVAHSVWWRLDPDGFTPFRPPLGVMAGFAVAVLLLAAFASRSPAKRAAALPPALAVRHVE